MYAISLVAAANAGVVQGVVVEQASGRPMARTRVRLLPVPKPGSEAKPLLVRAGISGHFMFLSVPEGLYVLTAMRDHYFPASFGQRLPGGQGVPVHVTGDSDFFAELRMRRMGAITGRVLDENGIGLPAAPVVAYRARPPLRIAARAVSDDRGIYRVHGLDPGKYWIRSGAQMLDDGTGLLPVFSPEAGETRDARIYPVAVDTETPDADLHAVPGALHRLNVAVQCQPLGAPVAVFLSSETGRQSAKTACGDSHVFQGLPPAAYEVYAEKQDLAEFGFLEKFVARDEFDIVVMAPPQRVNIAFEGIAGPVEPRSSVSLLARRQDLAETGTDREITSSQMTLAPGHWEFGARTGPGEYVESIASLQGGARRTLRRDRPADRFDVFIEARPQLGIKVVVRDTAGHTQGSVRANGTAVPGIPVFLWPVAEQARRSLRGTLQTLSDVNGQYRFDGLPPGDYRVLATFDLSEADEESMDLARALIVHVDASQSANVDLAPWSAPY